MYVFGLELHGETNTEGRHRERERGRQTDKKKKKTEGKRDSTKESENVIDREAQMMQGNYDNEG